MNQAFTQFLGTIAGQFVGRYLLPNIARKANLGQTRRDDVGLPGEWDQPVIIPAGAEVERQPHLYPPQSAARHLGIPTDRKSRMKDLMLFGSFIGLLWYAAKETTETGALGQVQSVSPAVGEYATATTDFLEPELDFPMPQPKQEKKSAAASLQEPEQEDLFPVKSQKQDLTLDIEDPATGGDPVISCLERRGWKKKRIEELQDSIIEKNQPEIFPGAGKDPEFTKSEMELIDAVDSCLQQIEAEFGSLEAAGLETDCPACNNGEGIG